MPLPDATRTQILEYCTRDLPGDLQWHVNQFAFIVDTELRQRLGRAFYSARYVAKLMEATQASDDQVHPFVKFQIAQYAAIYEAAVTNLLWGSYDTHPEVQALQTHKAYKKVAALGSSTSMMFGGEELYPCVYRSTRTRKNSIPFPDRLDCAVRIGLVDAAHGEDIKTLYQLRNLAHIETEAEKQIEVEIEQSRLGYWRLKPFLEGINSFVAKDHRSWAAKTATESVESE